MRIPDQWLESTVYLYPSDALARAGERMGGTGFLIGLPLPHLGDTVATWLVTNRHVINGGSTVVRINTHDGKFDTIETDERLWIFHPEGDDVAVCPVALNRQHHKCSFLTVDWLLTKETLEKYAIGPGDHAIVIGRFVNHEGKQRNNPTVRFGQISQMPHEKIINDGRAQESFLVEIRSLGGYSGSPVLVYLDQAYYRPIEARGIFESGPWLLGIDWCMIPSWEPVCDASGRALGTGMQVPANTGMMGVVPAWRIRSLLTECEPVNQVMRMIAESAVKARKNAPPTAIPTVAGAGPNASVAGAVPSAKDENPTHREDFNSLLGAAAQTRTQGDQT